jgi:hypothetical protein
MALGVPPAKTRSQQQSVPLNQKSNVPPAKTRTQGGTPSAKRDNPKITKQTQI